MNPTIKPTIDDRCSLREVESKVLKPPSLADCLVGIPRIHESKSWVMVAYHLREPPVTSGGVIEESPHPPFALLAKVGHNTNGKI
jgi:hypothetical protein